MKSVIVVTALFHSLAFAAPKHQTEIEINVQGQDGSEQNIRTNLHLEEGKLTAVGGKSAGVRNQVVKMKITPQGEKLLIEVMLAGGKSNEVSTPVHLTAEYGQKVSKTEQVTTTTSAGARSDKLSVAITVQK